MQKNQKVVVANSAPHHAGRIGYFQFFGEGASKGVAVLSANPSENGKAMTVFAVSNSDIS
jgi:hypothetical protein